MKRSVVAIVVVVSIAAAVLGFLMPLAAVVFAALTMSAAWDVMDHPDPQIPLDDLL